MIDKVSVYDMIIIERQNPVSQRKFIDTEMKRLVISRSGYKDM